MQEQLKNNKNKEKQKKNKDVLIVVGICLFVALSQQRFAALYSKLFSSSAGTASPCKVAAAQAAVGAALFYAAQKYTCNN